MTGITEQSQAALAPDIENLVQPVFDWARDPAELDLPSHTVPEMRLPPRIGPCMARLALDVSNLVARIDAHGVPIRVNYDLQELGRGILRPTHAEGLVSRESRAPATLYGKKLGDIALLVVSFGQTSAQRRSGLRFGTPAFVTDAGTMLLGPDNTHDALIYAINQKGESAYYGLEVDKVEPFNHTQSPNVFEAVRVAFSSATSKALKFLSLSRDRRELGDGK